MERLMAKAMQYPWVILAGVLAITIFAAFQLPRLEVAISPQSLIAKDDPSQRLYKDTVATFGSDRITLIYVSDPDLFRSDKLASIESVIGAVEALPFVEKTRSLFSVPEIRLQGDLVTTKPYLFLLPVTDKEAQRIKASALKNPFVRNNLLSPDGTALAVNVYLKEADYAVDPDFDVRVSDAIESAIAPLSGKVAEAYQIGLPYVSSTIAEEISRDQIRIVIAGFAVLLLSLLLMLRRSSALIIPLTTASLSVVWLLGGMALVGVPLSVLTAVVPVLLVIIGSTEDVHLLAEYYDGLSRGYGRLRAARAMSRRLGLAIGLTFLTSCLGFLALSVNPIGLVREFGLVASIGLAVNFLLTALLVPVLLGLLGERRDGAGQQRYSRVFRKLSATLTVLFLSHRRLLIALSIGVLVGCVLLATRVQVDNSILRYLPEDSPVQERITRLREDLAGIYTFQIVVDGHIDGAFERISFLEEIREIQAYIAEGSPFDSSTSLADYVALLNSAVNETGEPELPYDEDVLEALMLFVDPKDVREYLSDDGSKTSIVVRHSLSASANLRQAVADLKAFIAAETDSDLRVEITGQSVLASNAVNDLALGQTQSLGLIILAIFFVVSVLFVTPKAGLIAVAINTFPIMALFGVMGLAGIPLDSATSLIAAIAVGVGVDHTMHFMVRYNQRFRDSNDELTAVARTIADEAKPIGTATLALAAGFGVLALSSFPPVGIFGLLSAMMMFFAFLATFALGPVLLSYVRLMTIWDVLSVRVRRDLSQKCPLFRGMRPLQIRRIILFGSVSRFQHGDTIMRRGEMGRSLFVLLSGRVNIDSAGNDGSPDRVEAETVGHVFGVAALMCEKPRVATATAVGPTEVLALDWSRIQGIARLFPRSATQLFKNLALIMGERLVERSLPAEAYSVRDEIMVGIWGVGQGSESLDGPNRTEVTRADPL
jgi:predicted RND superfamily exporter protein